MTTESDSQATLQSVGVVDFTSYVAFLENLIQRQPQCDHYLGVLRQYLSRPSRNHVLRCLSGSGLIPVELPTHGMSQIERESWLVVVEGFPAPETVRRLGYNYRLRPEVFLGHLEMERVTRQMSTSFELPTLPSARGNIVHIRTAILGRFSDDNLLSTSMLEQQAKADRYVKDLEKKLFEEKRYGDPRIRKMNIHSQRYFSIEQLITLTVAQGEGRWTGVLFLDHGDAGSSMPTLNFDSSINRSPFILPIADYNINYPPLNPGLSTNEFQTPMQTRNVLQNLMRLEQLSTLSKDPFRLTCILYNLALSSWAQILNVIDQDTISLQTADVSESVDATEQLRCNISFLGRIESYIQENMETLHDRGSCTWPQDNEMFSQLSDIQKKLIRDHEYLLKRCQGLYERCGTTSELLTRATEVLESKRNIAQAERIEYLTKLAFFFLPVSLVASIFGMNVKEIQESFPSVWTFFVVALGVLLIAYLPVQYPSIKRAWIILNSSKTNVRGLR